MYKLLYCVFILCFIALCKGDCDPTTFLGGKFARCQTLNSEYDFYWTVSGEDVTIALNLRGYTNPWVGLGVSVNGGMMGGDIALAQYINGAYTLEDRFATQFARPQLDTLQNLEFISGSCVNQNTVIIYKRKLVPCDVDQDQPILQNATQMIYAYGVGPFDYHGPDHHGTVVSYFHTAPVALVLPSNYSVFNITMPTYEMPAKDTTYTCVSAILPHDSKYHIVRWRPIISNPAHIHHMVLFGCYFDANTTVPYECGMAPSTAGCANVIIAWTVGQLGDDFVGDFALPIGTGTATGTYVVLQIHYNNPEAVSGVIDHSGLSLVYTPILRTYDVGTVPMSVPWSNKFLVLAPGQPAIYHYTRCHSECTQKSIPSSGITIINWFPHMHQLGSKIWLSHIRNGTELPEIHRDNHYDFLRQQNFPVSRTIYPGDSLMMNCIWDTSTRTAPVYGGESTSEEMCVGIFQYYPAAAPPTFTRCTDLHEYFNTSGDDLSYAVCNKNNATVFDPYTKKNSSYTPVVANPSYVALPTPKSTCPPPTVVPTSPPLEVTSTATQAVVMISSVLFVALCLLL